MVPRNSLFAVPVPGLDGQTGFRNVAECVDEGCGKTAVREQRDVEIHCCTADFVTSLQFVG